MLALCALLCDYSVLFQPLNSTGEYAPERAEVFRKFMLFFAVSLAHSNKNTVFESSAARAYGVRLCRNVIVFITLVFIYYIYRHCFNLFVYCTRVVEINKVSSVLQNFVFVKQLVKSYVLWYSSSWNNENVSWSRLFC